ncbi:TonB family protein [Gymnodinialimonas sp. 2305UL16-5]|uniref:TonB family protein n=1 Tax=Gymnodinialimonas mytili TaxID=3126503 RepID=UPI0030AA52E4
MRAARVAGALAAVFLSGGAHLVGSAWFAAEPPPLLDGGGEPAPARLGTAFADMVAGMPGTSRPDLVEPTEADRTMTEPVQPDQAMPNETAEVDPSQTEAAATLAQPTTNEAPIAATPSVIAATPRAERPAAEQAIPAPATEVAAANGDELLAPLVSPRPARRPDDLAPEPQPEPPTPTQSAASGNAATDTIRGSATGSEDAGATVTSPNPQPAPQAGDAAAVAAYPGQVMRQISRQGRPRLRHTGPDAVVAFQIGSNGALVGASVSRSSGNAELDQTGLSIIQRAAPFPPPPLGAQTSFSVAFGGR